MKVLLLAENWPPRVGGIENYLTNIARHLEGVEVTVVAPKARGHNQATGLKDRGGVFRKRFFWPLVRPAWLPLFVWLHWRAKKEKYDAVLCGKALFEGLAGYYLKKRLGIPYVVFTYAMEVEKWSRTPRERKKLIKVLKAADRVVYINEVTKQSLRRLGVKKGQLLKLWPGVAARFLREVTEEEVSSVLDKYGLSRPYLFTLARLEKRKGMDLLLEAFSRLDQARFGHVSLVVAGEGSEKEQLDSQAGYLFLGDSVKFLGAVPDEDLPALYAAAELFALTPREAQGELEGFGIVYLEAAACGTPALGTDTGGVPEAVRDGHTGLVVPPEDAVVSQKVLTRLLSDKKLREKLGQQARQRAWREFAWPARVKKLKQALEAVTGAFSETR